MPDLFRLANLPWFADTAMLLAALVLLVCNRIARRWWTLTVYLAARTSFELALMWMYRHAAARAYFNSFWIFSVLEVGLTFLVTGQVLRRVATRRYGSRLAVAMAALAPIAAAVVYMATLHSSFSSAGPYPIIQWALVAQRATAIGCALAFGVIFFLLDVIGFGWHRRELAIACGVSVRYIAELALSFVLTVSGVSASRWDSAIHEVLLAASALLLLLAASLRVEKPILIDLPRWDANSTPQENLCA